MFSFFKKKKIVSNLRLTGVIGNVGKFKQGIEYSSQEEMIKKANGQKTIPQIFFDEYHVGGYQELRVLEKDGKLIDLIK